ncbi:MAG: AAA family ATPase [Gaiellaceae bacterium]
MANAPRRERKVVTVLFCDLVGFTSRAESMDPEDVEALLRPYHERVRAELERHGGTVEKFIGDAVMALFGAPTAHEDDPERAVRAALAIREFAVEERLELRVGITTGEALVSLDARPDAGEGMASGDVVNTAARVQSAAPVNGVIVDETTFRATRAAIDYDEADAVEAKGKSEPIVVWEAVRARSRFGVDVAHEARSELVGRERELGVVRDAFERARHERTPQLLTLVGVPDIGKSRLVYELQRIVDADPELITWRQGRCLAYGDGITMWALGEIVKAQAGVLEQDSPEEIAHKTRQMVEDTLAGTGEEARVEAHLLALLGLAEEAQLGGDRRKEAFAAWRRFLEGLAEKRTLVLVVEDIHWADESLLDFLDELVDWVTDVPLLVVATARPELLERRPGWGGGKLNATTLALARSPTRRPRGSSATCWASHYSRPSRRGCSSSTPEETRSTRSNTSSSSSSRARAKRSRFPRPSRASSPHASTASQRRRRISCRMPRSSGRSSGQARSAATRRRPAHLFTHWSARASASCAASGARHSRGRASSPSRTRSYATSPTGRSPAPTARRSTV